MTRSTKGGEFTEYGFEDKYINTKKRNVATMVKPLLNGGVDGYLYVDHLKEYENHPKKTKMGHIRIEHMTEDEFRMTLEKVIKDYK